MHPAIKFDITIPLLEKDHSILQGRNSRTLYFEDGSKIRYVKYDPYEHRVVQTQQIACGTNKVNM